MSIRSRAILKPMKKYHLFARVWCIHTANIKLLVDPAGDGPTSVAFAEPYPLWEGDLHPGTLMSTQSERGFVRHSRWFYWFIQKHPIDLCHNRNQWQDMFLNKCIFFSGPDASQKRFFGLARGRFVLTDRRIFIMIPYLAPLCWSLQNRPSVGIISTGENSREKIWNWWFFVSRKWEMGIQCIRTLVKRKLYEDGYS